MNIIQGNIRAIKNIFRPWVRATRSEFWWVMSIFFGGIILAAIIDQLFLQTVSPDSNLYSVLTVLFVFPYIFWLILALLVTIRRLHDMEMTGWFALLYLLSGVGFIIMAVICSQPGTVGPNKYGPNPLYGDIDSVGEIFE